jgi:chitin disaccharide deacetylase
LKRLVITADDVGLHPGMTRGALAACVAGAVTAVSVSPVGRAFEAAVDALRGLCCGRVRSPDVGVHFTLVGERPLSPAGRIRSLLGRDGAFLSGYPALAWRYLAGRLDPAEVEVELRAQVECLLDTGLPVVHANSHQHLHLLPGIFEIVLRLAEEHGIPFVRIPEEPAGETPWSPRALQLAALHHLGRRARRRLAGSSVLAPRRTLGVLHAGHLDREILRTALPQVAESAACVTELVCHPGIGDAELGTAYDWGYEWDRETATLCDPLLPGLLRAAGVELVSFSQIFSLGAVPTAGMLPGL